MTTSVSPKSKSVKCGHCSGVGRVWNAAGHWMICYRCTGHGVVVKAAR